MYLFEDGIEFLMSHLSDISLKSLGADNPELRKDKRELDAIMIDDMIVWILFYFRTHRDSPYESIIKFSDYENWSFEEFIFPIFLISEIHSHRTPPDFALMHTKSLI